MTAGRAASRGPSILVVLALTNLVAYASRNALFAVYPDLRARFGLDDEQIGLLTTVFLIPHALATLPFGWAGDRYDRRRVIALGMLLASVAGAAGAFAADATTLAASRALVGLGTAAVVPVANSILAQIYDGPAKASRIAVFNLGLMLGGVAGFVVGLAVGFPGVVLGIAAPGAALAFVLLALPVPAHPAPREALPWHGYVLGLGRLLVREGRPLLRIRTLRWLVVSTTAMAFAAGGFNAWLLDFLQNEKHMTKEAATTLLSIAIAGAVAGVLFGGKLADRMRARWVTGRLWTIALGMTLAVPCTVASLELPAGAGLYVAGIANFFFFSWYHAPIAASVDDLAPRASVVAAQGLVIFTMHLLGTAPSSYVVGLVSDHSSLYTAMWVPAGALVVAALAMLAATTSFAADHRRVRGDVGGSAAGVG
jgi:MFS transporter, Spinster family, sphingosine-1-phosphate transporter